MHYLVGVMSRDPRSIANILDPYGQENEEYFERVPYMTRNQFINEFRRYRDDEEDYTDDEIWQLAHEEYGDVDDEEEMIYENYNPGAHWDWWTLGGRFTGQIIINRKDLEEGERILPDFDLPQRGRTRRVNGARLKNILWSSMNKLDSKDIRTLSERWDNLRENCYERRKYETKENYIMKNSIHIPYAFVDIDGQWLDENEFDNYDEYCQHFIDTIHNPDLQDWWYVIVDCHF